MYHPAITGVIVAAAITKTTCPGPHVVGTVRPAMPLRIRRRLLAAQFHLPHRSCHNARPKRKHQSERPREQKPGTRAKAQSNGHGAPSSTVSGSARGCPGSEAGSNGSMRDGHRSKGEARRCGSDGGWMLRRDVEGAIDE